MRNLSGKSCITMFILVTLCFVQSLYSSEERLTPIVLTNYGPVQGFIQDFGNDEIYHFYGIPFAQPPIGSLRFLRPNGVLPWSQVHNATKVGPQCYQITAGSEDCLYLNILARKHTFMNKDQTKKPVMVFIHGGSFQSGSGFGTHLSEPLVSMEDVILVTINYRLNVFGFMHTDDGQFTGNLGLWDQNLALQWINENIVFFGGDPDRVTIFGQSAGSKSVYYHLMSPKSRGFFQRAILQSGVGLQLNDMSNIRANLSANLVLDKTGCHSRIDRLGCLQALPAEQLFQAIPFNNYSFSPVYGDEYLPYNPERAFIQGSYNYDVEMLIGINSGDGNPFLKSLYPKIFEPLENGDLTREEGSNFLKSRLKSNSSVEHIAKIYFDDWAGGEDYPVKRGLARFYTDVAFACPTFKFVDRFRKNGARKDIFVYYLTRAPESSATSESIFGVWHGEEITFLFGPPFSHPDQMTKNDSMMSKKLMKIWSNFAEFGSVPRDGGLIWPSWKLEEGKAGSIAALRLDLVDSLETQRIYFCLEKYSYFEENLTPKLHVYYL